MPSPPPQLETGTYEIIRARLADHAGALSERLEKLNAARKSVFGSVEPELLGTERVTTPHNCVPRDIVHLDGGRLIFGYNVHLGLKSETALEDVFAMYQFGPEGFAAIPLGDLHDDDFLTDFRNLFKYYKHAVFAKFRWQGPHLFMVFRVGQSVTDVKTFKWTRRSEGGLAYEGNRSDHELKFPPQHEFEWKRAHRDHHRQGRHPHISIEDRVFVETIGGDLTLKVEDNTDTGAGIYSEPVANKDQTLDDAEVLYAIVDQLVILKIRPFQEKDYRHLVFSGKVREARRIDAIAHSCVLLPEAHGIIFSNGCYLQNGDYKIFDGCPPEMIFSRRIASPNGEDHLFAFHNLREGIYVLIFYNIIEQKVRPPIICNGYCLFADGSMVVFRSGDEPQKHHALQIWKTPFLGRDEAPAARSDGLLAKLGQPAVVNALAECREVLHLLRREDTYADLYVDLVKRATAVLDGYFWLGEAEACDVRSPLLAIREAAGAAVDEFDKVRRIRQSTQQQVDALRSKWRDLATAVAPGRLTDIDAYVKGLASLRGLRGEVIAARDLRYVDRPALDELEKQLAGKTDELSQACVAFLLQPESLDPYRSRVAGHRESLAAVSKATEAAALEEQLAATAAELELLIEIVSNLKIEDATQTTRIIESISAIYAALNQTRAELRQRRKALQTTEGAAQFDAQLKLLSQAVANYLDLCDAPAKCDEYLSRATVQIEELESRFADFDDYIEQLAAKREEIYDSFETRKLQLVEERNRRTGALQNAADRILGAIQNRLKSLDTLEAIHAYFASDLMVDRVRNTVATLHELGDTVKADLVESRLKTLREDAVRQLKDRLDLFAGGANIIQLGRHRFTVNTQPLELTIVPREGALAFHLTGTSFFEPVEHSEIEAAREVWPLEVVSESPAVYRGEYLAWALLRELAGRGGAAAVREATGWDDARLAREVTALATARINENYVKGVHDADAARILRALLLAESGLGIFRHAPAARALGRLFWQLWKDPARKTLQAKLTAYGACDAVFGSEPKRAAALADLECRVAAFADASRWPGAELAPEAAAYLFDELTNGAHFAVPAETEERIAAFEADLKTRQAAEKFRQARHAVERDPRAAYDVCADWLGAHATAAAPPSAAPASPGLLAEAAALLALGLPAAGASASPAAPVRQAIAGLAGNHPRIDNGSLAFDYHDFTARLRHHEKEVAPRFRRLHELKRKLVHERRDALRLAEFQSRVLSSFVRNKLIDSVFLSLIGDNLAKQVGVAGEAKRTDLMGLLLLVSPPGYGKTTLMEYLANRLGLVFVKINGPAIGHAVTSVDPAQAPNSGARAELEKLNLAFEMGDNVMIYLDDIQHTNPELLQKFISLCDAQRKIEGVYRGRPKTYDFRGRKVVVVMAGNPYTESGEKFKIPDMLANRADTYNLGDIIGDHGAAFEMSFLENAVTSNPALQRLSTRSQKDIWSLIGLASAADGADASAEFESPFSADELNEIVAILRRLMRVRDTVLRVNQEYIRSAAQADEFRTEPPFKLQGSYRNMNRLAEKVRPIMTDEEVDALILDHYVNEAQTLTTGAEANLLKFKEITGRLAEAEAKRWDEIRATFRRNQLFRQTDSSDPVGRVVAQLATFRDGLDQIQGVLRQAVEKDGGPPTWQYVHTVISPQSLDKLRALFAELAPLAERAPAAIALPERPESPALPLRPEPAAPEPYEVEVRYSVPEVFAQIIQKQFEMMQAWAQAHQQSPAASPFNGHIQTLINQYESVVREVRELAKDKRKKYPSSEY